MCSTLEFAAEVTEVLAVHAREAALYHVSEFVIRCAWFINSLVMPINIYIYDKVNEPMGFLLFISIFWGINYLIKYSAVLKGYATK